MTGSSRKEASKPAPGTIVDTAPAVKDATAPMPTREFMLGLPLQEHHVVTSGMLEQR